MISTMDQVQSGSIRWDYQPQSSNPSNPSILWLPAEKKKTGGKKSSWAEQTRDSSATSCPQAGFQPEKHGKWVGMNISMAVSGTGGTCVQYKAYVRAKFQGTSTKYGLIWYSTSILGSWNSQRIYRHLVDFRNILHETCLSRPNMACQYVSPRFSKRIKC